MRVWNSIIDMGCYEYGAPSVANDDPVAPQLSGSISATNYPNPFNPETTIRYSIDEPGMVALEIYNLKGQLVKTLAKGITDAGRYSAIWNGTDNNGKPCASGVYLYKLNTKNKTMVQKMLMLK